MNHLKTYILLAAMTALYGAVRYMIAGRFAPATQAARAAS